RRDRPRHARHGMSSARRGARRRTPDGRRARRRRGPRTARGYPPTSTATHARGSHFSELFPGGLERRTSATAAVAPTCPTEPRLPSVTVVLITRRTFLFLPLIFTVRVTARRFTCVHGPMRISAFAS